VPGGIVQLLASFSVNYNLYPTDRIRLFLPGFFVQENSSFSVENYHYLIIQPGSVGANFSRGIWNTANQSIDMVIDR
jgi:hypothetical protein